MSDEDAEYIKECEALARCIGDTPKYNDDGEVIPFGQIVESKPRFYVVWRGRAVGIFGNW